MKRLLGIAACLLAVLTMHASAEIRVYPGASGGGGVPAGTLNGTLTATRVPFASDADTLADDADMTFATDTLTITKVSTPTVELGSAATDATLTRSAAGLAAIEGVVIPTISSTHTLTNKSFGIGSGSGVITPAGLICKGTGIATTGTAEEVLGTCAIPANTLNADGDSIVVWLTGVSAATANNKSFRVRFGGVAGVILYDSVAAASNNQVWTVIHPITLTRTSSTTMRSGGVTTRAAKGGTATVTFMTWTDDTETVDYTIANDLVITGTTPTASGDLTLNTYSVMVAK